MTRLGRWRYSIEIFCHIDLVRFSQNKATGLDLGVWPGDGSPDDPPAMRTNAAAAVVRAIERILGESDTKTPDLGGGATTSEVGEAIAAEARALMA